MLLSSESEHTPPVKCRRPLNSHIYSIFLNSQFSNQTHATPAASRRFLYFLAYLSVNDQTKNDRALKVYTHSPRLYLKMRRLPSKNCDSTWISACLLDCLVSHFFFNKLPKTTLMLYKKSLLKTGNNIYLQVDAPQIQPSTTSNSANFCYNINRVKIGSQGTN